MKLFTHSPINEPRLFSFSFSFFFFPRQTELVRRLHNVVRVLQKDQTIDPQDPEQGELPHLVDLSQLLCQPKYMDDREKDVRLASLVACLEILGIVRAVN